MMPELELPRYNANCDSHHGDGKTSKTKILGQNDDSYVDIDASTQGKAKITLKGSTDSIGKIILSTEDCKNLVIQLRQAEVCVGGVTKYALVLMSEPRDAPIT